MPLDRRIVTSFLGFLLLGMPYAALGVAWPSISADLGRPLGDLGLLLVATTIGYVPATAVNGPVTHRLGTGTVLPVASALATAAIVLFVVGGSWAVLLAAAVVLGVAGGALDAGANAHIAVHGSTRAMGWLHAMYGIGATVAPALTTEIIDAGGSWRTAFVVLAVAQLGVTALFALTRNSWPDATAKAHAAPRLPKSAWGLFAVALATFALYTGVEVSAGEWTFSLFTEARGLSLRASGYLISGYWASLTVGRIAMGIIGHRVAHRSLLLASLAGTAAGLQLLWWAPSPAVGAAGLVLAGFFLAPIFPVLMLIAAARLGPTYAPWAVGYLIAAAGLGAAILPGVIGLLVDSIGVSVIAPTTAIAAILLLAVGMIVAGRRPDSTGIDSTRRDSA